MNWLQKMGVALGLIVSAISLGLALLLQRGKPEIRICLLSRAIGVQWWPGQKTVELSFWRWTWRFKKTEGDCTRFFRHYQEGREARAKEDRARILKMMK